MSKQQRLEWRNPRKNAGVYPHQTVPSLSVVSRRPCGYKMAPRRPKERNSCGKNGCPLNYGSLAYEFARL
ncbi:hypothetical protein H5410_049813 [Solanum commersonii]|uniref:Uncharacterized protein n=1 Tax=Solanum commersonii TaxID=4109 RepID=A0A9J5WTW6_SOLCO|nr:hypothetical protein H5410_049813 [Solanum commersonii]